VVYSKVILSHNQNPNIIMADKKYRVLVGLKVSERPKSYNFYCFRCNNMVAEISGKDVIVFDDAASVYQRVTTGVKCRGRLAPEERVPGENNHCPVHYYFEDVN
jgi:hypothetical protein